MALRKTNSNQKKLTTIISDGEFDDAYDYEDESDYDDIEHILKEEIEVGHSFKFQYRTFDGELKTYDTVIQQITPTMVYGLLVGTKKVKPFSKERIVDVYYSDVDVSSYRSNS